MAIVVIQKDLVTIEKETTTIKIKEPYIELLRKMEKRAFAERQQLHKYMRKQNVKVISLEKNDTFSSYLYVCQGREEKRNYFNPTIRKKVEQIIRELMENTTTSTSPYLTNS